MQVFCIVAGLDYFTVAENQKTKNHYSTLIPLRHGGDHCPLPGLWAVALTGLQDLVPIEATTNVNLLEDRGAIELFCTNTDNELGPKTSRIIKWCN